MKSHDAKRWLSFLQECFINVDRETALQRLTTAQAFTKHKEDTWYTNGLPYYSSYLLPLCMIKSFAQFILELVDNEENCNVSNTIIPQELIEALSRSALLNNNIAGKPFTLRLLATTISSDAKTAFRTWGLSPDSYFALLAMMHINIDQSFQDLQFRQYKIEFLLFMNLFSGYLLRYHPKRLTKQKMLAHCKQMKETTYQCLRATIIQTPLSQTSTTDQKTLSPNPTILVQPITTTRLIPPAPEKLSTNIPRNTALFLVIVTTASLLFMSPPEAFISISLLVLSEFARTLPLRTHTDQPSVDLMLTDSPTNPGAVIKDYFK